MHFRPNRSALALVLAASAVSACEGGMMNPFMPSAAVAGFAPITTEEAFRAQVVGREVVYANGAIGTYGADGTWAITQGDSSLGNGTWVWQGDRWCSQGSTYQGPVPQSCDAVAISDTAVRFTREDGSEGALPFRT